MKILTKNISFIRRKFFFKRLNIKNLKKNFFYKKKFPSLIKFKKGNFIKFYKKYKTKKYNAFIKCNKFFSLMYSRLLKKNFFNLKDLEKLNNSFINLKKINFIYRRKKFLKFLGYKKKKKFNLKTLFKNTNKKYISKFKKKKKSKFKCHFYSRKAQLNKRNHKKVFRKRFKKNPLFIRLNNLKKSIRKHKFKSFVKYKEARYKKMYRRIGSFKLNFSKINFNNICLRKKKDNNFSKRIKRMNKIFLKSTSFLKNFRKTGLLSKKFSSNNIKKIDSKKLDIGFLKKKPLVIKKGVGNFEQTHNVLLGFNQINSKVLRKLRLIKKKIILKKKKTFKLGGNVTFFNSWILFFHSFNLKQLYSTCTKNLYLHIKKNFIYWSFVQRQQKYSIYFWYNFYNFRCTFSKIRRFKSSLILNLGKANNSSKLLITISFNNIFCFIYIEI